MCLFFVFGGLNSRVIEILVPSGAELSKLTSADLVLLQLGGCFCDWLLVLKIKVELRIDGLEEIYFGV